jgi:hypothetical protein
VCQGSTQTYSISPVAGAASYTWTLPSGWTGTSATETLTAIVGVSGGLISVTAENGCGTSPVQTLPVTVNLLPQQPAPITGNTTVCEWSQQTYSVPPVAGASSYTWSLPPGWTGFSTTESITVVPVSTSGTISVTASNSCGTGPAQTVNVTNNTVNTGLTVLGPTATSASASGVYQWIDCSNNQPVPGATGSSFTATVSGIYAVVVTENGCTDTSACVPLISVGISPPGNGNFRAFPNPAAGWIVVDWSGAPDNAWLEVCDMVGKELIRVPVTHHSQRVDLGNLKNGVYSARLCSPGETIRFRLVMER